MIKFRLEIKNLIIYEHIKNYKYDESMKVSHCFIA